MLKNRLIARLDIKRDKLIKGIHLEGLRVVGNPVIAAMRYYEAGIDEVLLIDAVASLYQRNNLDLIIKEICREIFIPVTVGGGIRSVQDAKALFDAGADKVAVNTAAISDPELLRDLSSTFGTQAIVLSIQAKRDEMNQNSWIAMTDNGREKSTYTVTDWVEVAQSKGIGEILLTSVDQEGTGKGFDLQLLEAVSKVATVPLQICGGFSNSSDALLAFQKGAQASVIAQALHYEKISISSLKSQLNSNHMNVRSIKDQRKV